MDSLVNILLLDSVGIPGQKGATGGPGIPGVGVQGPRGRLVIQAVMGVQVDQDLQE